MSAHYLPGDPDGCWILKPALGRCGSRLDIRFVFIFIFVLIYKLQLVRIRNDIELIKKTI